MVDKIRRFTKNDWYSFGGAEPFSQNSDPFILEQKLGEVEFTMIGDAQGIEITMTTEEECMVWTWAKKLNAVQVEGEMRAMIRELDIQPYTYAPDLAYRLDHNSKWTFNFQEL